MPKKVIKRSKQELINSITSNIREFPSNINAALKLSAKQNNFSHGYARTLWYGTYSKNAKIVPLRDQVPCLLTMTDRGFFINKKNVNVKKSTKNTLKLVESQITFNSDLQVEDKAALFDMLFS